MEIKLIEEIKKEIHELEAERARLIAQKTLVDNPPITSTVGMVNHINAIKEKLEKQLSDPKIVELINDEDIESNGKIITIPNTRARLYKEKMELIKDPLNIFYYAYTLKIAKTTADKCFEPNFVRVYDFFDNENIIGKVFINFEAPDLANRYNDKFHFGEECKMFERENFILIEDNPSKNIKNLKVNPYDVRNLYMDKLIDGTQEEAEDLLSDYFIVMHKGKALRTRKPYNN